MEGRVWRTIQTGIDEKSLEIRASEVSASDVDVCLLSGTSDR
jgi:hypothetical protein